MQVVVAEDSMLLRGLVRLLTEAACEVVTSVADFIAAIDSEQAVRTWRWRIVRMPPTMTDDGLHPAVEARGRQLALRGVLVLSAYIERSYADLLLSDGRGRVGYLLKDRVALDVLVDALRTITAGGKVLDPEVVAQLLVARRADPRWRSRRGSAMCSD